MTDHDVLDAIERGVCRAVTERLGDTLAIDVIAAIETGMRDSILRILETDFTNPALAFLEAVERRYVSEPG